MNTRKTFTPQEANRTLPLVRKIVADILVIGQRLRVLARGTSTRELAQEADALTAKLKQHFAELAQIGCEYKDWDFKLGLVDYPAVIDGRDVLLCWRSDEPEVKYYHGHEEGYAGRRPLPEPVQSAR